jgi:hypothetical protein
MRRLPLALLVVLVVTALTLVLPQLAGGTPKQGACPPGFERETGHSGDPADHNNNGVLCFRATPNSPAIEGVLIDDVAQIPA